MNNTTTNNTSNNNGTAEIISQAGMTQRVTAGTAWPLLSEGAPGPVRFDQHWWAVPQGQEDYRPVTDSDQLALLNRSVQRLTRARAAAGLPVGEQ